MLHDSLAVMKTPRKGRFLFPVVPSILLGLVALLAAWLAPNHYPPWTSFHGETGAFAAICLLAFAGVLQGLHARADLLTCAGLALAALIATQWAAGQIAYGGDALVSILYVLGAVLSFALGHIADPRRRIQAFSLLGGATLAAAAMNVLIGVLQWLYREQTLGIFAADRGPDMRVYGNLGQPNHMATLCLMGVVMALWFAHRAALKRWQFLVLVAWLSLGLVLTESRAGLLGAVAVGVVLLAGRKWLPGSVRFVAVWWSGITAGYLLLPLLNANLLLTPARSQQLTDDNQRFVMWRQALAAIGDAPWLGHGWRQTMPALKEAALQVPGRLPTDYAHNLALDLFIWVGVPLALALIAAILWWLVRRWVRIAGAQQLLLFAATVPVFVHSQFEFPFAYAYFLFPAAWLLGALDAEVMHLPHEPARIRMKTVMLFAIAAYAALCGAVASEYLQAEEDYRVMRFELRRVGRVPAGHAPPQLVLLTQLQELLEMGRIQPAPGMTAETLERLRVASESNGWATLDLNYATALGFNGQPEEASRRLAQLERVYGEVSAQNAYAMFRAYQASQPGLAQVRVP